MSPHDQTGSPAEGSAMRPGRVVPLDQLVVDEGQPRRSLDAEALGRLASSMAANGLIQPIVVTPVPGRSDRFRIVAGWRRAEAASKLGWRSIKVVVVASTTPLAQAAENTARTGLSPAELMGVVADAHAEGRPAVDIASALGVSDRLIRYYLTVLEHPDLVEAVGDGMSLRAAVLEARERGNLDGEPAVPPHPAAPDPATPGPEARRRRRRARAATERLTTEWADLDEATRAEIADRLASLVSSEPDRAPTAGGADGRSRSDPATGGD